MLSKAVQELSNILNHTDEENVMEQAKMVASYNLAICTWDDIIEVIIPFIEKLLTHIKLRQEAFYILDNLLFKLPVELIKKKSVDWIKFCIHNKPTSALQLSVLIKLALRCYGCKEFDCYLTQNIAVIVGACSSKPSDDITEKLNCLTVCVKRYPSFFKPFRKDIENNLYYHVSNVCTRRVARKVGTLLHALQEVPVGNRSNLQQNWTAQFYKLCSTVHRLYDDFPSIFETGNFGEEVSPLDDIYLTVFAIDELDEYHLVYKQLQTVVTFLNCMLEESFSQPKQLKISIIIDVLQRGLAAQAYENVNFHTEHGKITILQKHQTDLLYLFQSLIICFNKQLLPLSARITKIILDCQELTQKEFVPTNSEYRVALYDLISCWTRFSHNDGSVIPYNKIISVMVKEITPVNESGALCLDKSAKSFVVQEGRNILRSQTDEIKAFQIDENDCVAIFSALTSVMSTVNIELDETNTNTLFLTLVQNIEAVQSSNGFHPYTSQEYVAGLYETFSSLFKQECYRKRPFFELAINVLKDCQNAKVDLHTTFANIQAIQFITSICKSLSNAIDQSTNSA